MSVYFDKARKCWRYDFKLKGVRYHDTKFKTMAAARDAEAEKRKEVKEGKIIQQMPTQEQLPQNPPTQTDMDFLELVNRRLDYIQAYNSKCHYIDMRYLAKRWVKEWGSLKCSEITTDMIQKFVIKRSKVSGHVANQNIRYLRAFFNHGKKWKWIKESPVDGLPFVPVEKRLKYVPDMEDIDKVVAQADPDTQDYLTVIRETMARVGEVNRMTWDDVNLKGRYVVLYTRKKKGGSLTPRKVPMTSSLFEIMERRFQHRDTNKPWVFWHRYFDQQRKEFVTGPFNNRKKIMKTLCQKAGVRYFRYHALRHSGASVMDSLNIPIGSIQRILGHENRTTTEIYLHSIGDSERVAMDIFEGARKKVPPNSHQKK
jgi:integrase